MAATRYVSQTRARVLDLSRLDRYQPDAALGEAVGRSYDPVRDGFTTWVLVADDDARADTWVPDNEVGGC
jgi:hypothetical protein